MQVVPSNSTTRGLPNNHLQPSVGWKWLEDIWPVEERPSVLQDETIVATMSIGDIHKMHKTYTLSKKEAKGKKKDTAPAMVTIPEGKDDCKTTLHQARWLRFPLAPPKDWYGKTPVNRTPIFKAMQFKFFGASNCLANKTIEKCHDRSECLELKHFNSENCNVSTRAKKEIKRVNEDGEVENEVTDGWQAVSGLAELKEAVNNYCVLMFNLWPTDPTPTIMNRVLNKWNWVSVAGSDSGPRVKIITNFFNSVLAQNADRAVNNECVLSFEEQDEIIKSKILKGKYSIDTLIPEKSTSKFNKGEQKSTKFQALPASNNKGVANKPSSGKGKDLNLKTAAGHLTCFGWNALDGRNCLNNSKNSTIGCFSQNGSIEYAHQCSHQKVPGGPICGGGHRRKDHK